MELLQYTAVELSKKIKAGEITVFQAAQAALTQIHACEPQLNSFVTVDEEGIKAQAAEIQKGIEEGRYTGPLAGVPIAVKDNMCTKGLRTTCSSRILENYIPTYEAEAVTRLRDAGMVILGKTNMDEFAMGSTTETSAFGPTKNPWNTGHVPGGSSGGSCSAVASGEAFCALGSDTGGSIRQPSSFCGVVGIKPTYGTVSRYGLIAYGSSLDQIGPVARSVEDCAALLSVIAGYDPKDSTSMKQHGMPHSQDGMGRMTEMVWEQSVAEAGQSDKTVQRDRIEFMDGLQDGVQGMRIGLPRDYFEEGLDSQVAASVRAAAEVLKSQGAIVEEFDLSLVKYAIPAYYTIASAEASSNLARFDGVKYGYRTDSYEGLHDMYKKSRSEGFGPEVKRRIMLGSFVLSSGYYDAYYLKALRTKALIKKAFDDAFARYDLILGPAAPTTAPVLGSSLQDPLKMYLGDIYTIAVNLAGLPGISVPCGLDDKGLPIGVQLIGDCFQEKKLFAAAYAYEQNREFPLCPMLEQTHKEVR